MNKLTEQKSNKQLSTEYANSKAYEIGFRDGEKVAMLDILTELENDVRYTSPTIGDNHIKKTLVLEIIRSKRDKVEGL